MPVGNFRTWVKYTERGSFPDVRRSFGVLRCNQCSQAPCVAICPVNALEKRDDGIVDLDPQRCIGCKSCMQACPYDALYINENEGVAEKCHFCAHRTERGLAPACAVVCPTEAIIPGDFHNPDSVVSGLKSSGELTARKLEAGTGPNVWYREATRRRHRSGVARWITALPVVESTAGNRHGCPRLRCHRAQGRVPDGLQRGSQTTVGKKGLGLHADQGHCGRYRAECITATSFRWRCDARYHCAAGRSVGATVLDDHDGAASRRPEATSAISIHRALPPTGVPG